MHLSSHCRFDFYRQRAALTKSQRKKKHTHTSFVTSPPDSIGFIKDCEFRTIIATYLGQPDPNLASLVGRYLGNKGKPLDDHGANLASECLSGGGFRRIHNNIQSLVQSMMKVAAGIPSVKEAVNFLLGKIGEPYINNYVDHLSPIF